jgi:transposase-like protein
MGAPSPKRAKYWRKHIDTFHASGLSQSEYCRKFDIKQPTLRYWRLRFGEKPGELLHKPVQLMPIAVTSQPARRIDAALRVVFEDAGIVEVKGDLSAVVELTRLLRGGSK